MLIRILSLISICCIACTSQTDQQKIFTAVYNNDLKTMQELLHKDKTLSNAKNELGDTLVHTAIKQGNEDLVKFFIENKFNLNIQNKQGNTPILTAVSTGYYQIIKDLLQANVDITIVNNSGDNAAKMALVMNKQEILKLFLDKGVTKENYYPELIPTKLQNKLKTEVFNDIENKVADAVINNNLDEYRKLLNQEDIPIRFNSINQDGFTILDLVVQNSDPEFLKTYLDKDGSVIDTADSSGVVPLMLAISSKNVANIRLLILAGANIHLTDKELKNILHYAVISKDKLTFDIIFYNLKRYNDKDIFGNTPLHYAAQIPEGSDIITILLESGANPNIVNRDGETPLHMAVKAGNIKAVEALKKFGANTAIENKNGKTPVDFAATSEMKDAL